MDKNNGVGNLVKLSGIPVPLPVIGETIVQPTIRDIATMGEGHFMQALSLFSVNAEQYRENKLEEIPEEEKQEANFILSAEIPDDYSLFISIVLSEDYYQIVLDMFFKLLFLEYKGYIVEENKSITMLFRDEEKTLDSKVYEEIKDIFQDLFVYDDKEETKEFNPLGEAAEKIAQKIEAARAKRAKLSGKKEEKVTTVIGTMASNYSIITNMPLSSVFDMTLPQLLIQSDKADKLEQRVLQNMVGAIHGFKDLELVDYKKPL